MKRHIITALTVCLLVVCLFLLPSKAQAATEVASGTCGDNLTWVLDDEGTMTISGTGDMDSFQVYSPYIVPWADYRDSVKELVIEEGVTKIGSYAFQDFENISQIVIPDSVQIIEYYAFASCGGLETIVIGDGVQIIEQSAFYYCTSVSAIQFGNSVEQIGASAFYNCANVSKIDLPESVKFIASGAFSKTIWFDAQTEEIVVIGNIAYAYKGENQPAELVFPEGIIGIAGGFCYGWTGLTSVSFPESLQVIADEAFYGCTSLSAVRFSENLQHIGNRVFSGCFALETVSFCECTVTFGSNVFQNCTKLKSLTLPEGTQKIGEYMLSGCSSLEYLSVPFVGAERKQPQDDNQYPFGYFFGGSSYTGGTGITQYYNRTATVSGSAYYCIPNSLTTVKVDCAYIPYGAFYNYNWLTTLIVGSNVKQIETKAFSECSGLEAVHIEDLASWCEMDRKSVPGGTRYLNGKVIGGELIIPDGVTKIAKGSFYGCDQVTAISIPDSVKEIEDEAFLGCAGLESIYIPGNVKTIGENAFAACAALRSVEFGEGVTTLGDMVFQACKQLEVVTFPEGMLHLGSYGFLSCSGLKQVHFPASMETIGHATFTGCTALEELTLPFVGSARVPEQYTTQLLFGDIFGETNYEGTVEVKQRYYYTTRYPTYTTEKIYYLPESLKTVTILGGNVGYKAVSGCNMIENLTILSDVTGIEEQAFYQCTGLKNVVIDAKNIGTNAFGYCSALVSVQIGSKVENINNRAFEYCSALQTVTLQEGIQTVGTSAFVGCSALTDITLPDSVETIGSNAFASSGIQTVVLPANLKRIEANTFSNCSSLKEIVIPDSVTYIGTQAFSYCSSLITITMSEQISHVGSSAFYNTRWLERQPEGTALYLGKALIGYKGTWPANTAVQVAEGTRVIADSAFYNCTNLYGVTMPDSLVEIGQYAFGECKNIRGTVVVPEGITHLYTYTFYNCQKMTSLVLPSTLTHIEGSYTIWNCNGLNELVLPDGMVYIGASTIGLVNLEKLTMPVSVEYNINAFQGLRSLKQVVLTKGTGIMPDYTATYKYTPWYLAKANGLAVTLEEGITNVSAYAFYDCYSAGISEITIPSTVTEIGECAFNGCSNMTSVTFVGDAPAIGTEAFSLVEANVYYDIEKSGWTEEVKQNYGGTLTWIPYGKLVAVVQNGVVVAGYGTIEEALLSMDAGCVRLNIDMPINATLNNDLYIDLNGYDLSGTVNTNGYKVYGMDSTTDSYSCAAMGYFNCVDENGQAIVPVAQFKSDITGTTKRYMAIKDENGYSFHRFYLGITHMSLKPTTTGVGYKGVFYGDEMVAANLAGFGFTLQLQGNTPVTLTMDAEKFVSGKTFTLRLDDFDVEHYGETELYANAVLQLKDGTVIQSVSVSMTMRGLMESLNNSYTALTAEQLTAVADMIKKYAIITTWKVENLI